MSLTRDVYCCTTPARVTLVAPVATTTGSRRARQQQQQWWHACCTVVACMQLASACDLPAAVCACVPDELRVCARQTDTWSARTWKRRLTQRVPQRPQAFPWRQEQLLPRCCFCFCR